MTRSVESKTRVEEVASHEIRFVRGSRERVVPVAVKSTASLPFLLKVFTVGYVESF